MGMTTTTAPARRADLIEADCVRCDGTGEFENYGACFGCNGTGRVLLTPAGLKARATRARRQVVPTPVARITCAHCEDTGRLVNYGYSTGKPCRHCEDATTPDGL